MLKFNVCLLAAAVSLGLSTTYAAGPLDGLEMDVLDAGTKPARAASRIALPQASGDERDYGAENAGSTAEAGDAAQGFAADEDSGSDAGSISIVIDEDPGKDPVDPEADGGESDGEVAIDDPAPSSDEDPYYEKPDFDGDTIDESPAEDDQVFTILPYPYEGDPGAVGSDDTFPEDETSPSEDFVEEPFVGDEGSSQEN